MAFAGIPKWEDKVQGAWRGSKRPTLVQVQPSGTLCGRRNMATREVRTPPRSGTKKSNPMWDKFVCNVFSKISRTVAEARVLAPGVRENKEKDDTFFIHTRVVSEVDEDLPELVRTRDGMPTNLLVLTISMDTNAESTPPGTYVSCRMQPGIVPNTRLGQQPSPREGGVESDANRYRVLERWILQRQVHESDKCNVVNDGAVVKQLLLLVRAVHSCLRLLPSHKTAVQLQSRNASMGLKYRLSPSLASPSNESCFGTHADPVHEYSFGEVETPSGRICVKVQYLVTNTHDYEVADTEFPTQGLQRRDGRSMSLPSQAPDLATLLAPHSPLGVAAGLGSQTQGQSRHFSPNAFPLPNSISMESGGGVGAWGGNVGRPPLPPTQTPRLPRRSLEGDPGQYGESPRIRSPGAGGRSPLADQRSPLGGKLDQPPASPSAQQLSPSHEAQHLGYPSPLSLPAQVLPAMQPGGLVAMSQEGSGGGPGPSEGAMSAGTGRGATGSDAVAVPGTQQLSSTTFVDHICQQQVATPRRPYSPVPAVAAAAGWHGRAGSSPGAWAFTADGSAYAYPMGSSPAGMGGYYAGSSPVGGEAGGFGGSVYPYAGSSPTGFATAPANAFGGAAGGFSPSSPKDGPALLAQSFISPFNDVSPLIDTMLPPGGALVDDQPGNAMQRICAPPSLKRRQLVQQQQQRRKQHAARVQEEDENHLAPLANSAKSGGDRGNAEELEMLMRLLDRKDPLFLLEESDVMRDASGWDSAVTSESEFDSLLSMPSSSDLSVGDLIW